MNTSRPTARLFTASLALVAVGALAQPLYRNVDSSGRVTFTDQPPAANVQPAPARGAAPPAATNATGAGGATGPALPYELRQVVQRYPVTLYSGEDCAPCAAGRSLLVTRGVPFDERIVKTDADTAALQRLSGQTSLPVVAIGAQQLKGFSDAAWSQYLDAAGYPKSSQLPSGFRSAPAQPLVAQSPAPGRAAAPDTGNAVPPTAPAPAAAPSGPTPGNPAGIRF